MSKFKVFLTFPQKLVNEPIIYDIGQKYSVVTNIRGASVTDEIALVALQIEGGKAEVDDALAYMVERGVTVENLETEEE
jgi:L-aspartate semialdehyde sulfurtransferase ferredoxin